MHICDPTTYTNIWRHRRVDEWRLHGATSLRKQLRNILQGPNVAMALCRQTSGQIKLFYNLKALCNLCLTQEMVYILYWDLLLSLVDDFQSKSTIKILRVQTFRNWRKNNNFSAKFKSCSGLQYEPVNFQQIWFTF